MLQHTLQDTCKWVSMSPRIIWLALFACVLWVSTAIQTKRMQRTWLCKPQTQTNDGYTLLLYSPFTIG
jgi:hypothetical protein